MKSAYRLLQISDSAFPRGAFAHSLGLENYVNEGTVNDAATLRTFIENVLLFGTAPLDGVYLREAWHCAERGDLETLTDLDRAFCAARPVAPLRRASGSVGRQFLRTAVGYIEDDYLCRYEERVRAGDSPGHYAIALGAAAHALGLGVELGLESLFYGTVAGFVAAAVRLVPLGQTDGQRVTASLERAVSAAVTEAMTRPLEEAYAFGPGHEIHAMAHHRLHTRLFVS